ncbi:transglutaminase [Aquimarina sp. 2304DJ70-9]|uniref:transglutaminase n=1 Tax=Aquimarina penaris TaxID=3231044 RepID=UPI0034628C15
MKNFNKLILSIALILSVSSFAQEYKFGKVSKEELLESSYPSDSSANAAVLYEKKKVYFDYNQSEGFRVITEVFKRIKFYNKNGFENASEEVFLYQKGGTKEEVSSLKGVTYTLIGGKIVETKLKKEGIFENEYSERYNQLKFTMPALKEGSVAEYKYKIISPFIYNIDKIYLQYSIPIKKLDVKVAMPEYLNFKKNMTGYLPIDLKESRGTGKIAFNSKSGAGRHYGVNTVQRHEIDYTINKNTITASNVPAFKKEPYSGNASNYLSSITYELQFEKYPNSPIKHYSTTWEAVAKSVFNHSKFGSELKKNSYYKEEVDQLIGKTSDPARRTALLYNFVKDKMTWNGKHAVITAKGVKSAYKDGVGNAAEINIMLISMLDYAGVSVKPVLVSSSKKTISLFPTLDGFDYVVARVKLDKGVLYLDATDKYGEPNVLSDRVIHGSGRVIAENGTSQLVNFRPNKPSRVHHSVLCELDTEGIIKGKQVTNRSSYLAHDFRVKNNVKEKEAQVERVQKRYGLNDVTSYELKGNKNIGKAINERFEFVLKEEVEAIEGEMFFSPLLFLRNRENIFKSNEREYPVDFGYGYSRSVILNITTPEGYEIVEAPKSSAFKLPENMGNFAYRSSIKGNSIQISVTETLNTPFIPANYYPVLKQFYSQIIQKEGEQVVLKKI